MATGSKFPSFFVSSFFGKDNVCCDISCGLAAKEKLDLQGKKQAGKRETDLLLLITHITIAEPNRPLGWVC